MARVVIGAVVGGVVLFAWGYAAWMFLGLHDHEVEPRLKAEDEVVQALAAEERGVYWIPGGEQGAEPGSPEYEAWADKHRKGPRGFLVYDPEGGEPMSTTTMLIGVAANILVALVIALMLKGAALRSWFGRFLLVVGVGVVVVLVMDVSSWNWMNYPDEWTKGFILDHLGGMAVLGILLASILKPRAVDA